jgi:hypothetical protein
MRRKAGYIPLQEVCNIQRRHDNNLKVNFVLESYLFEGINGNLYEEETVRFLT